MIPLDLQAGRGAYEDSSLYRIDLRLRYDFGIKKKATGEVFFDVHNITNEQSTIARDYTLDRSTTIAFATAADTHVTLEVFDVRGRRMRTLVDGVVAASTVSRSVTWSGRTDSGDRAPAGVYFYRLTAGDRTETRKMTLAK